MILYLVRHGETAYNREGRGLGAADIPLTPEGEAQSERTCERMACVPLQRVVTSPLQRASHTASRLAAALGAPLEVRTELIELDVGQTEGLLFHEARDLYRDFMSAWSSPEGVHARMPGGESLADLDARLAPLAAELRVAPEETAAVVSHNFVLRVLLSRLLSLDLTAARAIHLDLASVSAVEIDPRRVRVRFLNDTSHLGPLRLD